MDSAPKFPTNSQYADHDAAVAERLTRRDTRAHELKCRPEPFDAIMAGTKRHEVRDTRDRVFCVGDVLHLRRWAPFRQYDGGEYTGEETRVRVTYITHGGTFGLPEYLCVMSFEAVL